MHLHILTGHILGNKTEDALFLSKGHLLVTLICTSNMHQSVTISCESPLVGMMCYTIHRLILYIFLFFLSLSYSFSSLDFMCNKIIIVDTLRGENIHSTDTIFITNVVCVYTTIPRSAEGTTQPLTHSSRALTPMLLTARLLLSSVICEFHHYILHCSLMTI